MEMRLFFFLGWTLSCGFLNIILLYQLCKLCYSVKEMINKISIIHNCLIEAFVFVLNCIQRNCSLVAHGNVKTFALSGRMSEMVILLGTECRELWKLKTICNSAFFVIDTEISPP